MLNICKIFKKICFFTSHEEKSLANVIDQHATQTKKHKNIQEIHRDIKMQKKNSVLMILMTFCELFFNDAHKIQKIVKWSYIMSYIM